MILFTSILLFEWHETSATYRSPEKKQRNQNNATVAFARLLWPFLHTYRGHEKPSHYKRRTIQTHIFYKKTNAVFLTNPPPSLPIPPYRPLPIYQRQSHPLRIRCPLNRVNLPHPSHEVRQTDPTQSSPLFAFVLLFSQICRHSGVPSSPRVSFIPICQLPNLLSLATSR